MKRFDVAADITKQLITISSAIFVGVAALAESILANVSDYRVFASLLFLYALSAISIIFGVLHLGIITNLIEEQEKNQVHSQNCQKTKFISIGRNNTARITCLMQEIFFILSIILLFATLVIDRTVT